MSYVPRLFDPTRPTSSLALGGGGPGTSGAPTSGASSPPPASDGGARFGALRSFFAANQPAANAQAESLVAPIEKTAESAVADANLARTSLPDQSRPLAERAVSERDDAAQKIEALKTPGGIAGLLGEGKGATYTEGQRAADAYLFGRTAPVNDAVNKWSGVLSALEPTYTTGVREAPEPRAPGPAKPADPYPRPFEDRPEIDPGIDARTDPSARGRARTIWGA